MPSCKEVRQAYYQKNRDVLLEKQTALNRDKAYKKYKRQWELDNKSRVNEARRIARIRKKYGENYIETVTLSRTLEKEIRKWTTNK